MVIAVFLFFILLNIIAYVIPKKLTRYESYTTSLFALLFGINVDLVLNFKYKLYGYFGSGFQWLGLLGEFLYFIPTNILFLNLYPYDKRKSAKFLYILGWSVFALVSEFYVSRSNFFNHHGWKLWYSAIVYPISFWILILHVKVLKKLLKQTKY